MTQECPDCGSHFTTYEQPGDTVAGYTTPVIEVDVPGQLEVVWEGMETMVRHVALSTLPEAAKLQAKDGWAVRQIVPLPVEVGSVTNREYGLVVYERPYEVYELADTDA